MGGRISVFLLTLSLLAVSPAWAQEAASGRPDELQIIEFDFDHQNNPPAVNLPSTIQTPPPATTATPAAGQTPAPAGPPAAKPVSSVPTPPTVPVKAAQPASGSKPEKVITIIGEPEDPKPEGAKTPPAGAQAGAGPSDEEILDSLFGPMSQGADSEGPGGKTGGTAAPAAPNGIKVEKSKKTGPRTPAVSPLRPPVSSPPASIKVEKSPAPPEAKAAKSPKKKPPVFVRTGQSADGRKARLFHDEAAVVGDFNPHRRAVIDPRTRPKPPAAANYPGGAGLTWADYRHWELGVYYWSLVSTGHYGRPLELATGRPVPIDRAFIPASGPQPKNYW